MTSVPDSEDEEAPKLLISWDCIEGRGHPKLLAEGGPPPKVGALGSSVLSGSGSAGAVGSSAEVSEEAVPGGRLKSFQGLA